MGMRLYGLDELPRVADFLVSRKGVRFGSSLCELGDCAEDWRKELVANFVLLPEKVIAVHVVGGEDYEDFVRSFSLGIGDILEGILDRYSCALVDEARWLVEGADEYHYVERNGVLEHDRVSPVSVFVSRGGDLCFRGEVLDLCLSPPEGDEYGAYLRNFGYEQLYTVFYDMVEVVDGAPFFGGKLLKLAVFLEGGGAVSYDASELEECFEERFGRKIWDECCREAEKWVVSELEKVGFSCEDEGSHYICTLGGGLYDCEDGRCLTEVEVRVRKCS